MASGAEREAGPTGFWHGVGEQLRYPTGVGGRLIGWLMVWVNRQPNRAAIAALNLTGDERVLELGFGPGAAVARMTRGSNEIHVWGVDQSSRMLEMATRRNRRGIASARVKLLIGEFTSLPFPEKLFDRVLLVNSAYFLDRAGVAAAEIHRVLAGGGFVVAYVTDAATMRNWAFAGRDTHRVFDEELIATAFVDGGFDRSEIRVRCLSLGFGMTGLIAVARKPSERSNASDADADRYAAREGN